MASTGGEIRELDKLLEDMSGAKRDAQKTKNRDAAAKSDQDSRKLLSGNEFILQAVRVKKPTTEEEGTTNGDEPSQKQKQGVYKSQMDWMASLSAAVRASDVARFALKREQLELERGKMYRQERERHQDGIEKLEERNERMKEMNDLCSEHTAIGQDAQRQMDALLDVVKAMIQKFVE